jgi:DNA mismatch repair protein MSH5
MIDLQQVSLALNLATNRSLLIIDEFGKGTEADGEQDFHFCITLLLTLFADGAGLACGILEYLVGLREHCPKVLAATHFHGMRRIQRPCRYPF